MKKKIGKEIQKIRDYEQIVEIALFEYAYKYPKQLQYNKLKNIERFVNNLIDGEIDYIVSNPKEYLEELNY
jgi:hypothetical protein